METLPVLSRWSRLGTVGLALVASSRPSAGEPRAAVPAWLHAHVGEGEGQIAEPVLTRARAFYQQKLREGTVRNPCYFAMDATRPNTTSQDTPGRRFYTICEAAHSFQAISAGHGSGRDLDGYADFANGRQCAKHFGNALDSELTAGGAYITAEIKPSFKGYYRTSPAHEAAFTRSFIQFEGEGEAANARQRAIGGHAAVSLKGVCRRKDLGSPHADQDGFVPFGTLVEYVGGRSNGCTSWSPSDAAAIAAMVRDDPATIYIYPDGAAVDAVARAVAAGETPSREGLYWNSFCLKAIGAPRFWERGTLEPIIASYKRDHPPPPPRPIPLCKRP